MNEDISEGVGNILEMIWKRFGKIFLKNFQRIIKFKGLKIRVMHKLLILQAFDKAKLEKQKSGIKNPSKSDLAKTLSQFIEDAENFGLGERTYRDYYTDAKKLLHGKDDITIKQIAVINGLCKYLGFEDYTEFKKSNKNDSEYTSVERIKNFIKGNSIILVILLLLSTAFIIYYYTTRQRWMIWDKDHYVEVEMDEVKYELRQLKFYKEERINSFRKIEPKCGYNFFNEDGSVRVWYGKNSRKELEYFTDLGQHPETGKTLKSITKYMINNHICNE